MTGGAASVVWRQAPVVTERRGPGSGLGRGVAVGVLAVAPPVAWAIHLALAVPVMVGVAALAALAAVGLRRFRSPVAVVTTAIAVGAVVTIVVDPGVGAWLGVGLLAGRWLAAPPGRSLGKAAPAGAMVPAAFLSVVAVVLAEADRSGIAIGAALAASVVVPVVASVTGGRSLAWVDRFAAAVAHALLVVLFGLLAIPVVVVPHLYGRVAGVDPFDAAGAWARPPRRRSRAGATWSNDRPPRRTGLRRALSAIAVLVVLVGGFALAVDSRRVPPPNRGFVIDPPPSDATTAGQQEPLRFPVPPGVRAKDPSTSGQAAAMDQSPWAEGFDWAAPVGNLFSAAIATRAENPYELLDFRSRYVNIVHGNRVSWTAPPCGCRRVTVWMYGGSTTWGMSQRDEHTIASELARAAAAHGLVVDVVNKGMNGFSHWQEAERFAWDLASGPAPDLVFFYDGVNDMKAEHLGERPVNDSADALWARSVSAGRDVPDAPPGARLLPPQTGDGSGDAGAVIAARYARVIQMSRRTAGAAGVPVRYVWQPSRYSRPFDASEPHKASEEENVTRRLVQSACDHQAAGIIRACYALAHVRGPLFTDDAHHNERAARVIAGFLYRKLESDLEALASGQKLAR